MWLPEVTPTFVICCYNAFDYALPIMGSPLLSQSYLKQFEPQCEKTGYMYLLMRKPWRSSAFATWIVHFLYFLNSKYTASSHLLCMYSLVYFGPARKLHCWFSCVAAHLSYSSLIKSFAAFLYKTQNLRRNWAYG